MTRATINRIAPSFIVGNVSRTIAFYREKLGFDVMYQQPENDPFFAIVCRDGVMIFLKHGNALPQPNHSRDPSIKWDAYLYVPDPDTLVGEFEDNKLTFHRPLMETSERLWGFEVSDPDGYILFFGRPED